MKNSAAFLNLFCPAIRLADQLSYPGKFIVSGILVLLSVSLIFFSFYSVQSERITTSRNELGGLKSAQASLLAIQYLQQHRGLSSGLLSGNTKLSDRRTTTGARVETQMAVLGAQLSPPLRQSEEWRGIIARWNEIRKEGLHWPQKRNYDSHTDLIAELLLLLSEIADHHQLILDSGVDTYYLIDISFNHLPQAIEQLGRIRATGTGMLARRSITEIQKADIARAIGEIQGNMRLLEINLKKAALFNPRLQQMLLEHAATATAAANTITQLVTSDILSRDFRTESVDYFDQVTAVIDTSYALAYQTLLPTLEILLSERIRNDQIRLIWQSGTFGFLLLVVGYFFIGISLSITSNVRILAGKLSAFTSGRLDTRVKLNCHDELVTVADNFNTMAITVARHTEELENARQVAIDAAQAKSRFLANMSHEIRTPMNAVISLSHLLLKGELNDIQRRHLNTILSSGEHLLGIINDILDLSKIEAGKFTIENGDFELERVYRRLSHLTALRAEEKGLEMVIDIDPAIPAMVHGDSTRLTQILVNFASNAVKFTTSGNVVFRAKRLADTGSTLTLRFEIQDTGIGLTEEQQQRLFTAFEQADAATTRRFGGTGLGLAISKHLAELMGGSVGVSSSIGKGSTFWLELPFQHASANSGKAAPRLPPRTLNILVVDGNPETRESIAHMLSGIGARIQTASSGTAALALIKSAQQEAAPVDFALIDWLMPEMDGIETSRQIAALGGPLPKVVLISAHSHHWRSEELQQAGIVGTLEKPVSPSELLDAILFATGSTPPLSGFGSWQQEPVALDVSLLLGKHVLLVDDNEINQSIALELLGSVGLMVDVADDGVEAVEMATQQEYDLVLMDMQMPNMDGLTATREIRRRPDRQALPIIAMTANAFADDRQACLDAGMNDHISKPIDPEHLYATMMQWLPAQPPVALESTLPIVNSPGEPSPPPLDFRATLDRIEGFDVSLGLRSVNNKVPSYFRLLRMYVDRTQNAATNLQQILERGEYQEARRFAHSLRGNSGSIGAVKIQQLALEIERPLSLDVPALPEAQAALDRLSHDLPLLIDALTSLLNDPNLSTDK